MVGTMAGGLPVEKEVEVEAAVAPDGRLRG